MIGSKEVYDVFNSIYPVGIIIYLTVETNPAELFGVGEWEQIKDMFVLAAGDSYSAGATGGEATHVLTTAELAAHTHPATDKTPGTDLYNTYSMQIIRSLNSASTARFKVATGSDYYVNGANPSAADYGSIDDVTTAAYTGTTGSTEAHNNMPPYYTAYCWRRIA